MLLTDIVYKYFIHSISIVHSFVVYSLFSFFLFNIAELPAASPKENQIKVAYLYQFTQFVEWPSSVFESAQSNFQLCVLGSSLFDRQLKLLKGRKHDSHPIVVRYPKTKKDVQGCHLLYFGKMDAQREAAILNQYKNTPLLTVSSEADFAKHGGTIGFVIINDRVRLEINRVMARDANVKLSAKLLEVGIIVKGASLRGPSS
ncbi:hypothetical protein MNBD_GAMMA08-2270 [hydrothermal vent metagenome]|uniref:Transmembrane protein n=1 Tax=hydrothermal vent metagenome TaxID=652676 RepID=A0A3B0Y0J3_9ZZZZ